MKCKDYKNMIPCLVMGEIEEDKKNDLLKHLENCPECVAIYESISQTAKMLTTADPGKLGEMEKLKIENEVLRRLSETETNKNRPTDIAFYTKVLIRVAAVIVIFLFGYTSRSFLSNIGQQQTELTEMAAISAEPFSQKLSLFSGKRFSATGLKIIAKGKSALTKTMTP